MVLRSGWIGQASPRRRRWSRWRLSGRAGLVDDERFCRNRAASLAERGFGDDGIRHDLSRQGVPPELVEAALVELEPEADRARRIVERRGPGPRTARYLAGKGFCEDALEAAFATDP